MTGVLIGRDLDIDMHTKKTRVKIPEEDSHLHVREEVLEETSLTDTLILDFQPLELGEKNVA